ncbi:A/G-specific adenine glycosylase [Piscinibacter sakaiensis]|uniref:Adenine DNA glycosylase n=1 Tax=Piscinibacter sakaiensis TaxID=1547922 RepID=A0A0K8P5C6_PISS1|nr:A/G-specific adenine glycosylase [Piscinibacter sakaiensis]GAP37709.1 A/G-specific adenine glycosylase [Piscinibacter sakaiensis]
MARPRRDPPAEAAGPDPLAGLAGGFADALVAWQRAEGRHALPWQRTRDPYRVWLSEVMLQQTQVATVLGYYERFLARFPDVAALAAAPLDEVLALWSGLGYYSRARNLHRCAQAVVAEHGGRFPPSAAALATLPGIGRSTAAAIAAFCHGERVAILDGNVKRVLGRVLAFDGDLAQAAQERRLWEAATRLLPDAGIEAYTQGLMDLGATVCDLRTPACGRCPVAAWCRAAASGEPQRWPVRSRTLKRGRRECVWLALCWRGALWLQRRPERGIWAGLWSLPELDGPPGVLPAWPGQPQALPSFTHVLTHLDWRLHPLRHALPDALDDAAVQAIVATLPPPGPGAIGRWVPLDEVAALGLPAALRKLLPQLLQPTTPFSRR